MAVRVSDAFRSALLDQNPNAALGNTAVLRFKTGARNATFGSPASGTILASFNLGTSPFGAATAGVATLTGLPRSTTAIAGGDAGCIELLDSGGDIVADWNEGDGFTIAPTTIANSQTVNLTNFTISLPQPA